MSKRENHNKTKGIHHVGLTVKSVDIVRYFFVDTLGYKQVGELADYPAVFLSDGKNTISLWQADDPTQVEPFDRKGVVGLHHLALSVDIGAALDNLHEDLKNNDGVSIEFAPEDLDGGPTRHMMCTIPGGGIRVEFVAIRPVEMSTP